MAIGKRLKSLVDRMRPIDQPPSPWRPFDAPYPLLSSFDPASGGVAPSQGLLAIWHLGVRPQWLKVAPVSNLQLAIRGAAQSESILLFRPNGGVYLAWAAVQSSALIVNALFLVQKLRPALQAVPLAGEIELPDNLKPLEFSLPPGTVE